MISYLASRIDSVVPFVGRRNILQGPPSRSMHGLQFMELSNCWVRYLVKGTGPKTIVLAPDSPVTMEAYAELVETLSAKHRVVLFETPAFGFSVPKPHFDFSFDGWTDTIERFLDRLGLGPYILAIPCVAGLTAIAIARRSPHLVEAIVSTQTPNWEQQRTWVRSWNNVGAIGTMTWPFWSQLLALWAKKRVTHLCHKLITKQKQAELMALSKSTLAQNACNPLPTACQCYLKKRAPGWLGRATQPAISIWGSGDSSHARCGTDRRTILEYLPEAQLVDLPHAGHFLEAEVPQEFARLVLDFVDALPHRSTTAAQEHVVARRSDIGSGVRSSARTL
jgi:pimeloyl-ACP methyl ester carboxylesterase